MSIGKAIIHSSYAALNAVAAVTLASVALTHFDTAFCVSVKSPNSFWKSGHEYCLPSAESIKFARPYGQVALDSLGSYSNNKNLLNFAATTAAILSLYCAKQALEHTFEIIYSI